MTPVKNVYALMLALVIVLSGCFGLGGGDAEADEDAATVINNYYWNNTTVDDPEWFSQGGIADAHWRTDVSVGGTNYSECEALGGSGDFNQGSIFSNQLSCDIPLTSIATQSGQMLVIHERMAFTVNTTCGGETITGPVTSTSDDEWRAPGHSMDCVHHLFLNDVLPGSSSSTSNVVMWSVAYSFRTVTVV